MPRIRVTNGPERGTAREIDAEPLTLGRDPSCRLVINDKGASRHHAQFFRIGEMCFIRDLESRNGTFVNDARVTEEMLRDGDRIQIGATVLVFEAFVAMGDSPAGGFEYVEDDGLSALELSLEDLSVANVGEGGDPMAGRHLRALIRLGRLLAAEPEETALLAKALPFVGEALHAAGAYIFIRDPLKGTITPLGTWDRGGERQGGQISRTIIRRAIQDQRALMTGDAMRDQRFSSHDSILIKKIHSVICAPLSCGVGRPGVLYIPGGGDQASFTEDELELAAAMADQIGLALSYQRARARESEQMLSAVRALIRASEQAAPGDLKGHSERLAAYAGAIGRQLQLPPEELKILQLAALLHHSGRLSISSARRSDEELAMATLSIVGEMSCREAVEPAIRNSREAFDGSGPEGLRGAHIPLTARILKVAHMFEMRTREAPPEAVSEELAAAVADIGKLAGVLYDPEAARALARAHEAGTLYQTLDEQ